MKKVNYDEASVVRSLSKKNSIYIDTVQKFIEVEKNNTEVGNGSWGKIDYLHKVHGYIVGFVTRTRKKPTLKKNIEDDDFNINSKTAKREAKLNMANMAKAAMRKVKSK